jgi:excisionase family DNA binding protein
MTRKPAAILHDDAALSKSQDPIATYLRGIVREEIRAALAEHRREPADGELVSAKRCAELLDVSLPTLRRATREGAVPAVRVGETLRYAMTEVREALRQRAAELASAPRRVRRA